MFLVCGEAVIDFFQRPGEPLAFAGQPAGSPFNVAIGLRRLGENVSFVTGLSRDPFGVLLGAALAREGIAWDLAPRTDRPTILAFVLVRPDGSPDYAFYGERGADTDVRAGAIPWPLPSAIDAIHIGGFPLAVEPAKTSYATLVGQAAATHFISIDPNVRPALMGDMNECRRHVEGLCAHAALVKASSEDVAHLYPGSEAEAVGARWLTLGAGTVVLTDGPNGAVALNRAGRAAAPSAKVDVVDTVGAGDSFMSALLAEIRRAGLLERDLLANASPDVLAPLLGFANRAAGVTCSRRGANPPARADVPLP